MGIILFRVEPFQLVLVDRRRRQQEDPGILGDGGRVVDDGLEVLPVNRQRDMLVRTGDTGVICAEEYRLKYLVSIDIRSKDQKEYHKSDFGHFQRREELGQHIDCVGRGVSPAGSMPFN